MLDANAQVTAVTDGLTYETGRWDHFQTFAGLQSHGACPNPASEPCWRQLPSAQQKGVMHQLCSCIRLNTLLQIKVCIICLLCKVVKRYVVGQSAPLLMHCRAPWCMPVLSQHLLLLHQPHTPNPLLLWGCYLMLLCYTLVCPGQDQACHGMYSRNRLCGVPVQPWQPVLHFLEQSRSLMGPCSLHGCTMATQRQWQCLLGPCDIDNSLNHLSHKDQSTDIQWIIRHRCITAGRRGGEEGDCRFWSANNTDHFCHKWQED